MNSVSRGIRNAFRNGIRTFSIIIILGLSIGLSLSMLIAHQAVSQKIKSVKASVGNTITISPAGARGFQGGGTALTTTQLASIGKLAHVTGMNESLNDRLTTQSTNLVSAVDAGNLGRRFALNSGQSFNAPAGGHAGRGSTADGVPTFTPPVTVRGTTDPSSLGDGGGTFTLKSGKLFGATSTDNVAILGTTLATKNNLTIGSTFNAYGATISVIGVFDAGNAFSNNQLIMPLATVQSLSGQPGAVTAAVVNVDSITNVATVSGAISKQLGTAADVTTAATQADAVVQPLQNIQTISLYSVIGAVGAGAVIILLTMIMIVRERRREIGVIKAIGASNIKVMTQFMAEAVTFTVLAAVIGIGLGVLAGGPITKLLVTSNASTTTAAPGRFNAGQPNLNRANFNAPRLRTGGRGLRGLTNNVSNVEATVGWNIILEGLASALFIAVVGSGLASFFIAKIRPSEVLRTE